MSEFLILMLLLVLFSFGLKCYLKSIKQPSLEDIESKAALEMEPRSHRLCMRACEIDLMQHNWQRMQMDDAWRDELHQYVADFEAAVAQRAKAGNVREISAYGGILIQKKGA